VPLDVREDLTALESAGRLRRMRPVDGAQGRVVRVDGREVVNFSSNNYLDLASHPALARAAAGAAEALGTGAAASRLIVGSMEPHRRLEAALADTFGRAALLFNSGYQANIGVLQALAGRGDAIYSDERNHASIIDGCRLSRATVHVYRHADAGHLAALLTSTGGAARRRLVVSDSVFSMDGDRAPVQALAALAAEHDAALILDEAHAVGALGPAGRGWAAEVGVVPDVLVATLGKALGGFGAFAVAAPAVVRLLYNRARSFVFSTALPPGVAEAAAAAVALSRGSEGDAARARLATRVERLARGLESLRINQEDTGNTAIFPILIGPDRGAMACCEALLEAGYFAQGIRPPTVAPGTARLRVALMASHTDDDIDGLLAALGGLVAAGKVPRT
jgi:8-amino-7-oxononanoate synthase